MYSSVASSPKETDRKGIVSSHRGMKLSLVGGFRSLHMQDSLAKKWIPFIYMHNCLPPYLIRAFLHTNSV